MMMTKQRKHALRAEEFFAENPVTGLERSIAQAVEVPHHVWSLSSVIITITITITMIMRIISIIDICLLLLITYYCY